MWKDEVSKRLAAHKSRKGLATVEQATPVEAKSSRAAQAAARVAARYAKAPSYSEMLAAEARAAVRAAEAASRAALEAQAAAESVLAGLENASVSASVTQQDWEPQDWEAEIEPPQHPSPPSIHASKLALNQALNQTGNQRPDKPSYGIRWEADLPMRELDPAVFRATNGPSFTPAPAGGWWGQTLLTEHEHEGLEVVEPAQPLHANLIQFPRELVATRKVRPRRAEGPYAASGDAVGQLSIFEVDPRSISIEPAATEVVAEASAPMWPAPDWSGIELDPHPLNERELEAGPASAAALQLAPLHLRVMAAVVDGALVTGAFLAAAYVTMANLKQLPSVREIEIVTALALLVIGVVYRVFFFTLDAGTPGMKWAGISLCTFADEMPTRGQRCGRLAAMLLSVLPVGLGLIWAIFDEDHLSWHDRLSGTYLRND
jgi:uncharacterized RDD family membrane protein YckC